MIMTVAAIITPPPPDVLSILLVTLPLWLLFELRIGLSIRIYGKQQLLNKQ